VDRRGADPVFVLVAEHEPAVAELARRYLAREGIDVRMTSTPVPTVAALAERRAAVTVLDLTMPGLDAREIRRGIAADDGARRGRGHARAGSVIFLAGSGGLRPRDIGVSQDACLNRPFSPRMLVARVLEILRRPQPARRPAANAVGLPGVPASYTVGGLTLNAAKRQAVADGSDVALTPAEFGVLACLADNAGRVCTREQLLSAARGDRGGSGIVGVRGTGGYSVPPGTHASAGSARAVDVYIAQLRVKLAVHGPIRTVRGVGYVLDISSAEHGSATAWQETSNPGVPR